MTSRGSAVDLEISRLVAETPGWCPEEQLAELFDLVCSSSHLSGDVVEIGSWCGLSASVLGLAARLAGNTTVHCVDLFPDLTDWRRNCDGTYSFEVTIDGETYRGCHNQTVWPDVFENDIRPVYERYGTLRSAFDSHIGAAGLFPIVRPFRGDSATFFRAHGGGSLSCRLAYIDGEHSYEAVTKDIRNIERLLVSGAWLCFDDAFSSYPGVNQAITELVINNDRYCDYQQRTRKFFVARHV